jgi:hypothetical protein
MRTVRRLAAGLLLAAAVGGCGGGPAEPREDPGVAMTRVIRLELAGKLERSWHLLIREQRRVVDLRLYEQCTVGQPVTDAKVVILGISDATVNIAALGITKTKAVRWRLTTNEVGFGRVTVSHTGHLIAQDGAWHWVLSHESLAQLRSGNCP